MKFTKIKKVIYICIYLSLYVFAPITSSAHSESIYTLKDLCRLADKNAQRIKIAKDEVSIAQENKNQALSALIPDISAFYTGYSNHRQENMLEPALSGMGIRVTQSLTINGKEFTAYEASKKGMEKVRFDLESIRSDYLLEIIHTYFEILNGIRQKEIAAANVKRLQSHKASVEAKLSVGNLTKIDLYRAEAELSKAHSELTAAIKQIQIAKSYMSRKTGIDPVFSISTKYLNQLSSFNLSLKEIETTALAERYEIKAAQKRVELFLNQVKYEKGDYWPTLDLEAGYKESKPSDNTVNAYDIEEGYAQLSMNFKLHDGGLRKARLRQAQARLRQAEQKLESVEQDIILESRVIFFEHETARANLNYLRDELKSAKENFDAILIQFQEGMADSIDIMDANTLLTTAERKKANAESHLYLTLLKIIYTRNQLINYLLDNDQSDHFGVKNER